MDFSVFVMFPLFSPKVTFLKQFPFYGRAQPRLGPPPPRGAGNGGGGGEGGGGGGRGEIQVLAKTLSPPGKSMKSTTFLCFRSTHGVSRRRKRDVEGDAANACNGEEEIPTEENACDANFEPECGEETRRYIFFGNWKLGETVQATNVICMLRKVPHHRRHLQQPQRRPTRIHKHAHQEVCKKYDICGSFIHQGVFL